MDAIVSVFGVWLGPSRPSELAEECMSTWPEGSTLHDGRARLTSIVPWLLDIPYFAEAYDAGHWAGASDVARLALLWEFGGTYLDVDVEVISPEGLHAFELDSFETGALFAGLEDDRWACNAVIIAPPKHPVVGALLKQYRELKLADTFQGTVTGATLFTEACRGRKASLFPPSVFYPWHYSHRNDADKRSRITESTITAHHWEASWVK